MPEAILILLFFSLEEGKGKILEKLPWCIIAKRLLMEVWAKRLLLLEERREQKWKRGRYKKMMGKNLSEWNKIIQWEKNWAKTLLMQSIWNALFRRLNLTLLSTSGEPGSQSILIFNLDPSYLKLTESEDIRIHKNDSVNWRCLKKILFHKIICSNMLATSTIHLSVVLIYRFFFFTCPFTFTLYPFLLLVFTDEMNACPLASDSD